MQVTEAEWKKLNQTVAQLRNNYDQWRPYHKELAQFILPARYAWLSEDAIGPNGAIPVATSIKKYDQQNRQILDATGTKAARDLAAGMLNGVTSPSRPWFTLRASGFSDDDPEPIELARWLEEVQRRMLLVLAESNFYNSAAVMLLDMVVFGTAGMLIYEDFEDVIRCYNYPVGEFNLGQDNRRDVTIMSRIMTMTVEQLVLEFGIDNVTPKTREHYNAGGNRLFTGRRIAHLIEPNREDDRHIGGGYAYREFYWECNDNHSRDGSHQMLRVAGFTEKPGGFPRWETLGNEVYGLSPGMDALPDIKQLQQETLRKAEALDKMTDPPVVLDAAMRNQQGQANPGTRYYQSSHSNMRPGALYDVRLPLGELTTDIRDVQSRIREAFFNDLFRMISNLETVRSATEIDARREEKLVLMGAVLERLENEGLDPFIRRVFGIMKRKGLIPDLPPQFAEVDVQVQYVSVLSDAQRAVGTGVIERFMEIIGNVGAIRPEILNIPKWETLIRDYAMRLNVPADGVHSKEELEAQAAAEAQAQQAAQLAALSSELTGAAKNLSDVEVGGGRNAFQELTGL